jgi:hypothetical protein
MLSNNFTPRTVAKYVASYTIMYHTANRTEEVLVNHTALEEDTFAVEISGKVVGAYVAHKFKPYTDKLVDKTADRIVAFREKRQATKDSKSE